MGNSVTGDTFTGEFTTLSQCSSSLQYAGYDSFSFHHFNNSCTYYHTTVSGLNLVAGGDEQIFFDRTCGDYRPTCGVQITSNADDTLKWGQQYAIKKLENSSWGTCVNQCFGLPNCYAIAITNINGQCILYSQSTSFINANSPPLNGATYAVQMYDLYCYEPY